jgi:hypothetical protein
MSECYQGTQSGNDSAFNTVVIVYVVLILVVQIFDLYIDVRQYRCLQSPTVPIHFGEAFSIAKKEDLPILIKKETKSLERWKWFTINKSLAQHAEKITQQEFEQNRLYNSDGIQLTIVYKIPKIIFWAVFFFISGPELIW